MKHGFIGETAQERQQVRPIPRGQTDAGDTRVFIWIIVPRPA